MQANPPLKPRRVEMLDEIRGCAIIAMCIYHASYDIPNVFGREFHIYHMGFMRIFQLMIACTFIFVSGISSHFSRNTMRRGFIVLGVGMIMTAATFIFMYDQRIVFGVLHFIGTAMIIYSLLRKWLHKIPPLIGFVVMMFLILITNKVQIGLIGFGPLTAELPRFLYETDYLFLFGFYSNSFYSADYFPLLPWLFLFFAGAYAGTAVASGKLPQFMYNSHVKALSWLGKRSLPIYIIHQPIIYAVLTAYFYIYDKI